MRAEGDAYKALDEAFRGAWFFTGSTDAAEYAVLDGIAALNVGRIAADVLLIETARSAMRRRADLGSQSAQASSHLPWELQRLYLLAPIQRDCFVLRVLLGITVGSCSRILNLGIKDFEEMLCAALQELPRLEARESTRREYTAARRSFAICPVPAETLTDTKGD
jgi:hypothetical protein